MGSYLVTGASQGIGYEIAKALIHEGHRVLGCSRNREKLEKLKSETGCDVCELDLASDDWRAFVEAVQAFGELDGLVHNAGLLINKPFQDLIVEEVQRIYEVNVISAFRLIQEVSHLFSDEAHIVGIGSVGGMNASSKFPGLTAYSSSKAALGVLIECLQAEYEGRNNWTFNCLALGAVGTEMLAKAFPGYTAPLRPEEMASFISNFILTGHQYFKGKTLPVSRSNP